MTVRVSGCECDRAVLSAVLRGTGGQQPQGTGGDVSGFPAVANGTSERGIQTEDDRHGACRLTRNLRTARGRPPVLGDLCHWWIDAVRRTGRRRQHHDGMEAGRMAKSPDRMVCRIRHSMVSLLGDTQFAQRVHFVTDGDPEQGHGVVVGYSTAINKIGYVDDVEVVDTEGSPVE